MRRALAALLIALAAGTAGATDYYASTSGSGAACSIGTPCTIKELVETRLACGDTGYINDGTYDLTVFTPDYVTTKALSCAGNPVVIRAVNSRQAILTTTETSNGAIRISNASNAVTYQGIRIDLAADARGIYIPSDAVDTTFDDIEIYINAAGGSGFYVTGTTSNLTISDSYIHKSLGHFGSDDGSTAVVLDGSSSDTMTDTLIDNVHFENWRTAITTRNTSDGGIIEDSEFENIHDHCIKPEDANFWTVRRNTYWHSDSAGQHPGGFIDYWCIQDWTITNNSLSGNGIGTPELSMMPGTDTDCTGNGGPNNTNGGNERVIFKNNIVMRGSASLDMCLQTANNGADPYCTDASCMLDSHNTYFDCNDSGGVGGNVVYDNGSRRTMSYWTTQTSGRWWPSTQPCANCLESDPLVTNDSTGDFTLQSGSPARDAGDDAYCAHTISGSHCDIGAFEYQVATTPATVKGVKLTGATLR